MHEAPGFPLQGSTPALSFGPRVVRMRNCAASMKRHRYRRVSRGSMMSCTPKASGLLGAEWGGELAQFRLQLAFALLRIGPRTDFALVRGCDAPLHRAASPLRRRPLKFQPDSAC